MQESSFDHFSHRGYLRLYEGRIIRKLRVMILMIAIIGIVIANFSFTVSAHGTGVDLTYWYSDTSDIGYFSSVSISVYAGSNSSWNALSPANIKSLY